MSGSTPDPEVIGGLRDLFGALGWPPFARVLDEALGEDPATLIEILAGKGEGTEVERVRSSALFVLIRQDADVACRVLEDPALRRITNPEGQTAARFACEHHPKAARAALTLPGALAERAERSGRLLAHVIALYHEDLALELLGRADLAALADENRWTVAHEAAESWTRAAYRVIETPALRPLGAEGEVSAGQLAAAQTFGCALLARLLGVSEAGHLPPGVPEEAARRARESGALGPLCAVLAEQAPGTAARMLTLSGFGDRLGREELLVFLTADDPDLKQAALRVLVRQKGRAAGQHESGRTGP